MYPDPSVGALWKSLYNPYIVGIDEWNNPQESLQNTINTMGTPVFVPLTQNPQLWAKISHPLASQQGACGTGQAMSQPQGDSVVVLVWEFSDLELMKKTRTIKIMKD